MSLAALKLHGSSNADVDTLVLLLLVEQLIIKLNST